jgi:hypothetical protein
MQTEIIAETSSFCQGLIYSVLQDPALRADRPGFTVAFIAAHPGAGCTYLTNLLANSLNTSDSESALVLNCSDLVTLKANSRQPSETTAKPSPGAPGTQSNTPAVVGSWRGSYEFRAGYMSQLRDRYPYVLIDCSSLKENTEVLSLARVVDGFFIVVEANKTQKTQLAYVEQTLERAGGKILGHLLNKRTYPIPEWLHNRLERWGQ